MFDIDDDNLTSISCRISTSFKHAGRSAVQSSVDMTNNRVNSPPTSPSNTQFSPVCTILKTVICKADDKYNRIQYAPWGGVPKEEA